MTTSKTFCPAVYELEDSVALSVLIQLLKAMFKCKVEVPVSLLSSLSLTLGKRGTELVFRVVGPMLSLTGLV